MIGRYLRTWGLNWGKGTGTRTEAQVVYETGVMGLAPPISGTVTRAIRTREGVSTTRLIPDGRLWCISPAKSRDHCMYHGSSSTACSGGNTYHHLVHVTQ